MSQRERPAPHGPAPAPRPAAPPGAPPPPPRAPDSPARAARRGQRVLLLAPGPAALDRILELLAERPEVCADRCLGRGESEEALPPAARCTWAALTRRLDEQAGRQAEAQLREATAACRR